MAAPTDTRRRRKGEALKDETPSQKKAKKSDNTSARPESAAIAVAGSHNRFETSSQKMSTSMTPLPLPRPTRAPSRILPHGNTSVGRVGQGYIAGMSTGPPSHAGIVDARLDIHGDDGQTYQAPSFYNQHEDLRELQIGQQVSFKAYVDSQGRWAFDVTLLQQHPATQR